MNNLEKVLFLEITNKQLSKLPDNEFMKAYQDLTEENKQEYAKLSNEIHDIYNYINSGLVAGAKSVSAKSIDEYNENIAKISNRILQIKNDFDLTLKPEISEKTKQAILSIFGKEYLDRYTNPENYNV